MFTPHMMEMSRLSGYGVEELKQERLALLREFTEEYRAVCVMKDSRTLVGRKESRCISVPPDVRPWQKPVPGMCWQEPSPA